MHLPEADRSRIDRITCEHCGHPVWDHHAGGICIICEAGNAGSPCGLSSLYGFAEAAVNAIEEPTFRN